MNDKINMIFGLSSKFIVCCVFISSTVGSDRCDLTTTDQLGPYFLYNAPWTSKVCDDTDSQFSNQEKLKVSGHVMGRNCKGVEGAIVEIWQAGPDGTYDPDENLNRNAYTSIQYDYMSNSGTKNYKCRSRVKTDSTGSFNFQTVMPGYYDPRPLHLHYRVSSKDITSVHQMYFHSDQQWGKVKLLTVKAVQEDSNRKSAVFNFTIDTDGTFEFGITESTPTLNETETTSDMTINTTPLTTVEKTDSPNGTGERENTCYSCSPCPDPFKVDDELVKITQCPPHGCRTWRNQNSKQWNRGCFLTSVCQPENAAFEAICCQGDNCNTAVNTDTSQASNMKLNIVILLLFILLQFLT